MKTMKAKGIVFFLCIACAALFAAQTGSGPSPALKPAGVGGSAPIYFIANGGQTDAAALYYARTPGFTLWVTREGLVFDRIEKDLKGGPGRSVTRMVFKNANKDVRAAALDPTDYRVSYFLGRDEPEWKADIPTSRAVLYKNLYDGIDLKVYGIDNQIEYDWIVGPRARPEKIRFAYSGARKTSLDGEGNLAVETLAGRILHRKPRAHQVIAGRRVDVEAAFRGTGEGAYGFAVGFYDRRFDLIIDPLVLAYSTYLGGYNQDYALKIAVDPTGAAYVCGATLSNDFPPVTQTLPREDIFVTKFSPDGKSLIYTAFFPSAYQAEIIGMAVDAKGFVYLAGSTMTAKFPVKNAFQATAGGGIADGFILKLARSGKSLIYSSYIGGTKLDVSTSVRADASGAAYIGGYTESPNFPTKKAYQKTLGGRKDAFLAKVAPLGTSLVYSTLLGGSGDDYGLALAADSAGAVTIAGITGSRQFPIKSAFQKGYGGGSGDAFVTKFSPAGDSLIFSSYLGGSSYEWAGDLALDASGAAYVVGATEGSFPLKNAFQKMRKGGYEAFITKIASGGKSLVYSSYLGGGGTDEANGVAVDGTGTAYITGYTTSPNFPIKSPFQAARHGSQDCFLTVVDPSGLKLLSSTYLGGSYRDAAYGIALDTSGAIYICGYTNSLDFPLLTPYQSALAGDMDAFFVKFSQGND